MLIRMKSKYSPQADYIIKHTGFYADGSVALELFTEEGQPQAKCTVCVPGYIPPEGSVLIKDWSENEGIKDALIRADIIEKSTQEVLTGFVIAYECKLTQKCLDNVIQTFKPPTE